MQRRIFGTPLAKKLAFGRAAKYWSSMARELSRAGEAASGCVKLVSRIADSTDVVHLFAIKKASLAKSLKASAQAENRWRVWVSWPKKSSRVAPT